VSGEVLCEYLLPRITWDCDDISDKRCLTTLVRPPGNVTGTDQGVAVQHGRHFGRLYADSVYFQLFVGAPHYLKQAVRAVAPHIAREVYDIPVAVAEGVPYELLTVHLLTIQIA
jgi:hypothetical protein